MKRSEINKAIKWSINLLNNYNIKLPDFGYWDLKEWESNKEKIEIIKKIMLGWDVTDFGTGDFDNTGSVLFTVRNGDQEDKAIGTPYAEKYILMKEGQGLPMHFHYTKTEDIINRGGGVLEVKLYNAKDDCTINFESDVIIYMDGARYKLKPGDSVDITPGNSITLTPYIYHCFSAKKGCGDLITGEISSVNDDNTDNHFAEELLRFSEILQDEEAMLPLCSEYESLLG